MKRPLSRWLPLARPKRVPGRPPRVLFYCASNVGLGHLMRVARVAGRLRALDPALDLLLVADSPLAAEGRLGLDLAVVKLPEFRFVGEEETGEAGATKPDPSSAFRERPFALNLPAAELRDLRASILLATARSFAPDLLFADTLPHGKRNELEPLLRRAGRARGGPIRVLQMRDVPAPPGESFRLGADRPRKALLADAALYDRILVAGDPAFFDVATEYRWPDELRARLLHVGFVLPEPVPAAAPPLPEKPARMLAEPGRRRIVAAFGGGWEADFLAPRLLAAFDAIVAASASSGAPLPQLFLFAGPALPSDALSALRATAESRDDLWIETFSPRFPEFLARCDAAFLQAGSTPFQLLGTDKPMVVYYRDYKSREQEFRARLLARFEGIETLDRAGAEAGGLEAALGRALSAGPRPRAADFSFDGADRAAREVLRLLGRASGSE